MGFSLISLVFILLLLLLFSQTPHSLIALTFLENIVALLVIVAPVKKQTHPINRSIVDDIVYQSRTCIGGCMRFI